MTERQALLAIFRITHVQAYFDLFFIKYLIDLLMNEKWVSAY